MTVLYEAHRKFSDARFLRADPSREDDAWFLSLASKDTKKLDQVFKRFSLYNELAVADLARLSRNLVDLELSPKDRRESDTQ